MLSDIVSGGTMELRCSGYKCSGSGSVVKVPG